MKFNYKLTVFIPPIGLELGKLCKKTFDLQPISTQINYGLRNFEQQHQQLPKHSYNDNFLCHCTTE